MRIFGKGKCKFVANFSATMVKSLPSHYFRLTTSVSLSLSLSLSLSHRLYLTHNIGSASALPIIADRKIALYRLSQILNYKTDASLVNFRRKPFQSTQITTEDVV